jgi:purine-cytosine permease-like protein
MIEQLIPITMLAIVMIAGYFMGRRDGLKMYNDLLKKFNNLQRIHNELLQKSWVKPTDYWDAEKEFYEDNHNFNHTE